MPNTWFSLGEPSGPKPVKIIVELDDGTVITANRPALETIQIDHQHELRDVLPGPWLQFEPFRVVHKTNMLMTVKLRLFADKTGNFVWFTKPLTLYERIRHMLRRTGDHETSRPDQD
jgi:hypothetical protein